MFVQLAAIAGLALLTPLQAAGIPGPKYPLYPPFQPGRVPNAVQFVCKGAPGAATMLNVPTGGDILLTLGNCDPPGSLKRHEDNTEFHDMWLKNITRRADGPSSLSTLGSLSKRDDACVYPDNQCSNYAAGANLEGYSRCQEQTTVSCVKNTDGPDSRDCQHIFDDFKNQVHAKVHAAFAIPQDKFVMFSYGTCAAAIHNHIPSFRLNSDECRPDLLWAFPEWSNVGTTYLTKCGGMAQNGIIRDDTGIDFYMQIYRA